MDFDGGTRLDLRGIFFRPIVLLLQLRVGRKRVLEAELHAHTQKSDDGDGDDSNDDGDDDVGGDGDEGDAGDNDDDDDDDRCWGQPRERGNGEKGGRKRMTFPRRSERLDNDSKTTKGRKEGKKESEGGGHLERGMEGKE